MRINEYVNDARERSQSPENTPSDRSTSTHEPMHLPNMNRYRAMFANHMHRFNHSHENDPLTQTNNQPQRIWNPAFGDIRQHINARNEYFRRNYNLTSDNRTFDRVAHQRPMYGISSNKDNNNTNHQNYNCRSCGSSEQRENETQLTEAQLANIATIARNFVYGPPQGNNNQMSAREMLAYFARRIEERDNCRNQQMDDSLSTDFNSESSDQSSELSSSISDSNLDSSLGSENID
ncbi:hypothetical protein PV327_009027 [Microctonus hyperodae]|uniref:Uncharacterized protein n=1 Tax=Microctonus hyperodae TaxID=165561 RepID=A0AA39FTZ5_MICHY|nr:hypothetical protein PV327_009027 [Microctonus hyperodae]